MTHFIKALIAGSALIAMAGAAAAEGTFETAFTYDTATPVETIYASLSEQAKDACVVQKRLMAQKGQALSGRFVSSCHRELMTKAVDASKMASLISLHAERTDRDSGPRFFAGRD